jgi:hypothetical protein
MAYRRTRDGFGAFFTALAAWLKLGLYGGDDGLSAGLNARQADKAAKSVGQKLELETITRGNIGVSFLSRRYGPDVWFGDTNNCCSIKRQLSKFHLTVHLPGNVTAITKLREKAFAFSLTDSNTPIIGPFVRKVLSLYPMSSSEFKNNINQWNVVTDASRQYENTEADWMNDLFNDEIPDFDHARFNAWLNSADGNTIFLPPPLAPSSDPDPKVGKVVVDHDLIVTHVIPHEDVEDSPKQLSIITSNKLPLHTSGRKPKPARVMADGKLSPFRPRKKKSIRASQPPKTKRNGV